MVPTPALVRFAASLLLGLQLAAQAPPPPVDPALPDHLKELKSLVADPKMADDFRAIGLVQKLTKEPQKLHPKDREKLARGLGEVFRTGKLRPEGKDHLYRETADALGKLAADGGKELAKVLADPRFKEGIPLRVCLIQALGRTEDDKQVDWLLDQTTRSPHDEIRAAAGEALGNFTSLDRRPRQEVVKQILREWGSLHSRSTALRFSDPGGPIDPDPENASRTLRAVQGPWTGTLGKLTGVSHSSFEDWQRWLNKNPNWVPPPAPKKP